MASGNVVGLITDVVLPQATFPQLKVRTGGSTPAENFTIYSFDAATIEYLDFKGYLTNYAGGGITVTIIWMAASATSNVTRWGGAFRRLQDDAEDIDTSQTYDYNDVDATTASVSGEQAYDTIAFTDGADMDSLANNEAFVFRLRRNAAHANDTMTGDAELVSIVIKET